MAVTRQASALIVDHTFGLTTFPLPTPFMGLHTRTPGPTGIVTGEPSSGGYARVALSGKMGTTTLSTGRATNTGAIIFPRPTGAWAGGLPLRYWALHSASSGGFVSLYGELDEERIVLANEFPPNFPPGTFNVDALFDGLSDLTKQTAKLWLDHFLGVGAMTIPSSVSLGLTDADPTSSGSVADELNGSNYTRQAVTAAMDAADTTSGVGSNDTAITFLAPTGDWNVAAYILIDNTSPGAVLMRKMRHKELLLQNGDAALSIGERQLALRAS
jgi:hypothetical protein